VDYRKKSALFQGKVALLPNLTLPPTNVAFIESRKISDYRGKQA
jgi:hypothetical protein